MNWLDFVILALIGIPAFLGLRMGMIKTVANLGGIIVGIVLAIRFSEQVGDLVGNFLSDETVARSVGFLAIIVVTLITAWIAASFVKRILTLLLLGWVDKVGGLAFGAMIGSVFVSAIITVMEVLGVDSTLADSTLKPYFDIIVDLMSSVTENLDSIPI